MTQYRRQGVRGGVNVDTTLATRDLNTFMRNLRKTDNRAASRPAAKFVAKELEKRHAPISKRNHSYRRKGSGETIRILSGNLRKSTKIFTFKDSRGLHVGPRYLKKAAGVLGGTKPSSSGFYARWVIEGKGFGKGGKKKSSIPNDFMERAKRATAHGATKLLAAGWMRALERISKRSLTRGVTRWVKYTTK